MGDNSFKLSKPGHSVRQSEEARKTLEKENFNLKLRLFYLENKNFSRAFKGMDPKKKLLDLFVENGSLKRDLNEQKEIMTNALKAIELLEREKFMLEKKSKALIFDQSRKIETLKSKSKLLKKARKIMINPGDQIKEFFPCMRTNFQTLKSQNSELFKRINSLKKELSSKTDAIQNLMDEKKSFEQELKATTEKLERTMCEEFSSESAENFKALKDENFRLKASINELSGKCQKLEKKAKEFERLITEQSSLMKALNRTIEAKNEELKDFKSRKESSDASFVCKINLACGDDEKSQFPFHNPLFGNFNTKYR